ncbi:4Fe-4S binding protein [bacterium]|nr:4Fe-4S binding protein [bacterium]
MKVLKTDNLRKAGEKGLQKIISGRVRVAVGTGTCGIGNGAKELHRAFEKRFNKKGEKVSIVETGCFGFCTEEPIVNVHIPGHPLVILHRVTMEDIPSIIKWVGGGNIPWKKVLCRIEEWDHLTGKIIYGRGMEDVPLWNEIPFFKGQEKIVMRNCGLINPEDITEYAAVGGYSCLQKVLGENKPESVIDEIKKAGLRGRGGAGFPTGIKWELMRKAPGSPKYIICNADEGDPGAYMNRNEIESDPHSMIEGMGIGAFATGAAEGIIYVRAEYPLAVKRLRKAVKDAEDCGFLGENIFGSGFSFKIDVVEGAGAFVCGEETAMISSLEGKSGRPVPRPPFPAQKGYKGKPTNINNVETWYNIPPIISRGWQWFRKTGTGKSPGTKVFSLVGKVTNTGLVELPLGTSLRTLVYGIGGGNGTKKIKAVQSGGPSGGCIPEELFDTPVDYESLALLGAIMGSGGMVVMDEDNCMVDVAKYFVEFTARESCGKCVPCREGLFRQMEILKTLTDGKGSESDLALLEELGTVIKDTALCGLGQTGPNPVLTTLKYFREEYLAHIKGICPAKVCPELIKYEILEKECIGCTVCARNCPQNAITGEKKKTHSIIQEKCVKCGICLEVCKFGAVKKI